MPSSVDPSPTGINVNVLPDNDTSLTTVIRLAEVKTKLVLFHDP